MNGVCNTCKKEFIYYPSNSTGKYCSRKCCYISSDWRNNQSKVHKTNITQGLRDRMSAVGKLSKGKKQAKEHIAKRVESTARYYDRVGRKLTEYEAIKTSKEYKSWRNKVYKRDGYTCQKCGDNTGGNLEAHHVIPFSFLLKESKVMNVPFDFDISTGVTLCVECHKKTDSYSRHSKHHIENKMLESLRSLWEHQGSKGDFELYYSTSIERLISKTKEKLT